MSAANSAKGTDDHSEETKRHQTEAQLAAIEAKDVKSQPLTSCLLPISSLVDTLSDATGTYLRGAQYLSTKYKSLRRIRPDGNCFYRAVMFAVCESILSSSESSSAELERLTTWAKASLDEACKHGYDPTMLEMFHDELVELFEYLATKPKLDEVVSKLNEESGTSEYVTWYLRVVTAAYLKADPDRFIHFIEGGMDIPTFCAREVEPMGRECEMVQVLALAEAMSVDVAIEYLDGRDFDKALTRHEFGPSQGSSGSDDGNSATKITLLYRPGHYDILY
jgi:ubiquitin thioesterase protein OTUB1